ncbi:MAG: EFR1 family ferrodoxin [Clostridia bacterium]|nr:EFR1 family ferrodoxin [Clostridia bacterium]
MIYYFSGTGNSRYAAEKIARQTGDRCVDIADIYRGKIKSVVGKTEVTGFVFPVYYGGMPEMVKRFVTNPEIKNKLGKYVFAVMTCGGNPQAAGLKFTRALGREPDLCASVRMPDNYVIAYAPATGKEAIAVLRKADSKLSGFSDRILNGETYIMQPSVPQKIASVFMYPLYEPFRTTVFYKATDKCVHCGMCAAICPDSAIKMVKGRPKWIKNKCQHCTACINRCPAEAIQFGRITENRGRYNIMKLGQGDTE